MSQFCEKCGARRGGTKFCTGCGASLSDDTVQSISPTIIDSVAPSPAPAATQKISAASIHVVQKQNLTDQPWFKWLVMGGLGSAVIAMVIAGAATFLKPTGIIDGEIKLPLELAQERAEEEQKLNEANAQAMAKEQEALRAAQEAAETQESLQAHEEEEIIEALPAVENTKPEQDAAKAVKAPAPPPVVIVKPARAPEERTAQTLSRDQEVLKQTNKTLDDLLK